MPNDRRQVAVFTGNRAEYGLLYPVLRALAAHPALEVKLIVSGAHLDTDFGDSLKEIETDGFAIAAEVKIDLPGDGLVDTATAIGSGTVAMARALETLRPDLLVVYGDRFESFAAMIAATQSNVPTAHIEGGDLTEGGALDDSVRHAMTKLAHLHFTTNSEAANRVLAMGEEDWRVQTVGLPAIDVIAAGEFASPNELRERFGIDPDAPLIVFTQHSVTTQANRALAQLEPSIEALRRLAGDGVQILITHPNNDAGGRRIMDRLAAFGDEGLPGLSIVPSVGRYAFHGLLALARDPGRSVACVGNSSSGIKETGALGCPTVNIGTRQSGRLRAANVIDVAHDAAAIYAAVRRCLDDEAFRRVCDKAVNPYGAGDAGPRIARHLAKVELGPALITKRCTLRGEARDGWYR